MRIDSATSPAERRFCSHCGSALWVSDPRWPELVHPFASAIDTPLPEPPEQVRMMLGSTADWVSADAGGLARDMTNIRRSHLRSGIEPMGCSMKAEPVTALNSSSAAALNPVGDTPTLASEPTRASG